MLVQSTQSRKSWKSRSRLVEIDTVDFLFRRLICTCTCTGKFRIYTTARNSRPMPYQKVIEVYWSKFRCSPPQIPRSVLLALLCLVQTEIPSIRSLLHSILISSFFYLFRELISSFAVLSKQKIVITMSSNHVIHIIACIAIFSYPAVVRIPKRLVPIPLDKRKCVVYSRDTERFLSATLLI